MRDSHYIYLTPYINLDGLLGLPSGRAASTDCLEFLRALRLTSPEDDLASIRRKRGDVLDGTCEWLTSREEFVTWYTEQNFQLLLLQGGPGIGKTMTSSFLIHKLEEEIRQDSRTMLAYFFCDDKDGYRNTAAAVLRSLLLQILRVQPTLFKHAQRDFDEMKTRLPELVENLDSLLRIFCHTLKDHDSNKIVILIDGLDECEESSRHRLLTDLAKMLRAGETDENMNKPWKFIITCRPGYGIEQRLHNIGKRLHIDSKIIHEDLARFINVKVDELSEIKNYPPKLANDIKQSLKSKAGGTFLWAWLVLDDISNIQITSKVRDRLEKLPTNLVEAYDRILRGIRDEDREDAICIIHWVTMARRPLTTLELATAQTLHHNIVGENTFPSEANLEEFQDGYKCCEPLLYLDRETKTINFIHQSVKEYLLDKDNRMHGDLLAYKVIESETDVMIFKACWRYLASESFRQGREIIWRDKENFLHEESRLHRGKKCHSFVSYAAKYWLSHAFVAVQIIRAQSEWIRNLKMAPTLRDWWLIDAAKLGHYGALELLLGIGADPNAKRDSFPAGGATTAMELAVESGSQRVVKLLLKHGASAAPSFLWAVELGYEAIAQLLIEYGANIAECNGSGYTALHLAAMQDQESMVRMLLHHGAPVNARSGLNISPLHLAVTPGGTEIVKLLVRMGADINAQQFQGLTSLHLAVISRQPAMVKLLIEMGADIMATNGYTPTPLMLAAEDGQNEVVKQLLGCKGRTPIDWKDFTGQTALIKAAAGGHKDTVRLLLENDASIDKRDNNGRTALFYAAVNCSSILRQGGHEVSTTRSTDTESYEAIVQLLVSRGADIN